MYRSVFPTRKSRENNTKNAKISKARKVAKYAKKLFAFKDSDTLRMGVSGDFERMYSFANFAEFS